MTGQRRENSPIFNPFLFITRYLSANIKHALRYESRGMETDVTKIHESGTDGQIQPGNGWNRFRPDREHLLSASQSDKYI